MTKAPIELIGCPIFAVNPVGRGSNQRCLLAYIDHLVLPRVHQLSPFAKSAITQVTGLSALAMTCLPGIAMPDIREGSIGIDTFHRGAAILLGRPNLSRLLEILLRMGLEYGARGAAIPVTRVKSNPPWAGEL